MSILSSSLITYFAVGIAILVTTRARRKILSDLKDKNLERVPSWKKHTFRLIIISGLVLFWPLFLPSFFSKETSALEELKNDNLFENQEGLINVLSIMCSDGCETDEIPNGHGEFGHAITNPIPTRTVLGSTNYLTKLKSSDGEKIIFDREGSLSSPVSPHPVDAYAISSSNGRRLATLYLSPYHKRDSEKAPRGFTLY